MGLSDGMRIRYPPTPPPSPTPASSMLLSSITNRVGQLLLAMRNQKQKIKLAAATWNLDLLLSCGASPDSIWTKAMAHVRHRRIQEWEEVFALRSEDKQRVFRETVKQINWDLPAEQVVMACDEELAKKIREGLGRTQSMRTAVPEVDRRDSGLAQPTPPQSTATPRDSAIRVRRPGSPPPTWQPTVQQTVQQTIEPTMKPTMEPTTEPTTKPTVQPTAEPMTETRQASGSSIIAVDGYPSLEDVITEYLNKRKETETYNNYFSMVKRGADMVLPFFHTSLTFS